MMRKYERFYGVRVMTFCVMSNHFHILVQVPQRPEVMPADEELLAEIKRIYSVEAFMQIRGTKEFVNTVFTGERHRFGPKRKTGARRLKHVDAGELRTLRELRVDVIT